MPGIFGIIDLKDKIRSYDLADRMRRILKHDNSYKDYMHFFDHCIMGGSTPNYYNAITKPVFNEDKSICLVMQGEIFNSDELKRELKKQGHKNGFKSTPELILYLYIQYGPEVAKKFNGLFNLAFWDEKKKSLTLINDRLGIHYLYFYNDNKNFLFAPELKALLQHSKIKRTLSIESIVDYFSFGFILGDRSFFKNIKLMPPGSILKYKNGKFSIEKYWDFPFIENHQKKSEKDYINEFDLIMNKVSNRQRENGTRKGIALSGGIDSRIIAGYLSKKNDSLYSFTFGEEGTDEVNYAARVADELGFYHQRIDYSVQDFFNNFDNMVWLSEGHINTSEYYSLAKFMADKVDVAFCGNGGDIISGKTLSKKIYKEKKRDAIIELLFSQYNSRVIQNEDPEKLFSPNICKHIKGISKKNFFNSFEDISSDNPGIIHFQHLLKYKGRKDFTRAVNIPNFFVRYRYPFFDNEVIDFFIRIPPKFRLNQDLYVRTLIKKFKELAKIPRPNRNVSLSKEKYFAFYYHFRNKVGNFFLSKWYRIFKSYMPRGYDANIHVEAYRNALRQNVYSIIIDGNKKRGYFNHVFLERLLNDHFNGEKDYSFLIHKLITFEIFNRLFLDREKLVPPLS